MIYAKVYDATVEDDYYKAMVVVEQRIQLVSDAFKDEYSPFVILSEIIQQLKVQNLTNNTRLELVAHLQEELVQIQVSTRSIQAV